MRYSRSQVGDEVLLVVGDGLVEALLDEVLQDGLLHSNAIVGVEAVGVALGEV